MSAALETLTSDIRQEIIKDPHTAEFARAIIKEGTAVAHALGTNLDITVEQHMAGAARAGPHRTSTLQDIEMQRPLELDVIAGAVVELASKVGVAVPHTNTVYACARLLEEKLCSR